MTCATCRHYRPRRVQSRCALTGEATKHGSTCPRFELAPRQTLAEWIEAGGVIVEYPPRHSGRND